MWITLILLFIIVFENIDVQFRDTSMSNVRYPTIRHQTRTSERLPKRFV